MNIQNKKGYEAIKKVIEDWKNDTTWINDVPNYFVKKDVGSYIGPNGEYVLVPSILDTTWLPDNALHEFFTHTSYQTKGLNNPMADEEYDAKEFKKVLDTMTSSLIEEIKNQIEVWEKDGKTIMTSNPFLF